MQNTLKFIKVLGKGVNSKVFMVQNLIDLKHYALKIIKIAKKKENIQKYLSEIQNLCKLDNPYIVKYIFSWYSENDQFKINKKDFANKYKYIYILMEYCEYTLDQYIQERNCKFFNNSFNFGSKKFKDKETINTLKFINQICNALKYIHKKELIHRDIKPSNIFLKLIDNEYHVKLGDFGISKCLILDKSISTFLSPNIKFSQKKIEFYEKKITRKETDNVNTKAKRISIKKYSLDNKKKTKLNLNLDNKIIFSSKRMIDLQETNLTNNIGTHLFMSPEQESSTDYDTRSDLYSLGITFFILIYPFQTNFEKIKEIQNLKNNKFNKYLFSLYPNISNLFLDLINDKDKRPGIKLIKRIFKNDLQYSLFDDYFIENSLKVLVKFENKNNFDQLYVNINKNIIYFKKDIMGKIKKKIHINDYYINLESECINLFSNKLENILLKMENNKLTDLLLNLISIYK